MSGFCKSIKVDMKVEVNNGDVLWNSCTTCTCDVRDRG